MSKYQIHGNVAGHVGEKNEGNTGLGAKGVAIVLAAVALLATAIGGGAWALKVGSFAAEGNQEEVQNDDR